MKTISFFVVLFFAQNIHADACANLTGNWAGQCVKDNGTTSNGKLKLTQNGCASIDYGSGPLTIGTITDTKMSLSSYDKVHTNNYYAWNATKTALERKFTLLALNSTNGNTFTEMATGTWTIENDQLKIDQKWYVYVVTNGVSKETIVRSVCTYNREAGDDI